jgi:hypothetical protein
MSEPRFPPGWDDERAKRLIAHYDRMTDEELAAEDEAGQATNGGQAVIPVPRELVPVVRRLVARHRQGRLGVGRRVGLAWCVCLAGWLFPAAIMAIGLIFQHPAWPPNPALQRLSDTALGCIIWALVLAHVAWFGGLMVAIGRDVMRIPLWQGLLMGVMFVFQLPAMCVASLLTVMSVTGDYL